MNTYKKNPNFKRKPSFKKWCNYCRRYGHSIAECSEKQQDNQNIPQKYREPNKTFYQYLKKVQLLPNKDIHSKNSSGKLLPKFCIFSQHNHLTDLLNEDDLQIEIHETPHKIDTIDQTVEVINIETTTQDQILNQLNVCLMPVPVQILEIEIIRIETLHLIDKEIIQTIETKIIQMIEINIETTDQEIIQITDQTTKDQTITIIVLHLVTFHKKKYLSSKYQKRQRNYS